MKKTITTVTTFFLLTVNMFAQDLEKGLYEAIASNSLDNVKKMVEELKADVNKPYENKAFGNPYPLLVACQSGNTEIAKYLIDKGADVNKEDRFGQTALIKLAYSPVNTEEAQQKRVEIFKMLLEKKIDLNAISKGGGSAISYAAYMKQTALVKELIDAGADVDNRKNDMAKTALMEAAVQGHMDIVKMLHENGADPKETVKIATKAGTFEKSTPADLAKEKGHMDVYEYLKSAKKIKKK